MKKIKTIWFILLLCLVFGLCGCEHAAKMRRKDYIREHSELTQDQKDLIFKGKLWTGMTKDEVQASLGWPTTKGKDILGKEEVWVYIYKYCYTPHADYKFERGLRLEFREDRLANWREE